jgi:hypothetical protein
MPRAMANSVAESLFEVGLGEFWCCCHCSIFLCWRKWKPTSGGGIGSFVFPADDPDDQYGRGFTAYLSSFHKLNVQCSHLRARACLR